MAWKSSVLMFALTGFLVLVVNLAMTVWALKTAKVNDSDYTAVLYQGSCNKVHRLNTVIHVLINILGGILLAGSNYCMQCLSAPSREDIDKAHAKKKWMDIGVPSMRNIRFIGWKRVLLWLLLGISSVPLHLLYNSSVFSTGSANAYYVYSVGESFLKSTTTIQRANMQDLSALIQGGTTNHFNFSDPSSGFTNTIYHVGYDIAVELQSQALQGSLTRLENQECIDAYSKPYQSAWRNVLVVLKEDTEEIGWTDMNYVVQSGQCQNIMASRWVCAQANPGPAADCWTPCDDSKMLSNTPASNWKPFRSPVQYCLAQKTNATCKLQFSLSIILAVMGLNLVKVLIMVALAFEAFRGKPPLLTVGDAISSFLDKPDPHTVDMCLLSKREVKAQPGLWSREPRIFKGKTLRLWNAVSAKRMVTCLALYTIALTVCAVLLVWGVNVIQGTKTVSSVFSIGLGSVNGRTIINSGLPVFGPASLVANTLLANVPQLILSVLYFTYNGLFTFMMLAKEWNQFSEKRKPLRVSAGRFQSQRRSHFLQLPYRYGIPLLLMSGLMHWLISQSLFLVSLTIMYPRGEEVSQSEYEAATDNDDYYNQSPKMMSCGYSPLGILLSIVAGVILVIALLIVGSRRFKTSMPLASSCSAAISAACHSGEVDGHLGNLQWGVISDDRPSMGEANDPTLPPYDPSKAGETKAVSGTIYEVGSRNTDVKHCAFSVNPVSMPQEGYSYAGKSGTNQIRDTKQ